jgi:hypothetical protein
MPTTLATGLPQLDMEAEATFVVDANDPSAVLTKVTILLSSGAPNIGEAGNPILLGVGS